MRCPVCKLENQPSAERCDCGHRFGAAVPVLDTRHLERIAQSVESIRRILLVWVVLSIAGGVVIAVLSMTR